VANSIRKFSEDDEIVPSTNLLVSLRALGYSFNSAFADLVDNSITAGSSKVWIDFESEPSPYIALWDNGRGMSAEKLKDAMRLGGGNEGERQEDDLGRFGLGLKTASLSQAKTLRVISKEKGSRPHGRSWDIGLIEQEGRWVAPTISGDELESLPFVNKLAELPSGTLVLWSDLDQVVEDGQVPHDVILELFEDLTKHLSLIFHRFLAGESRKKLELYISGAIVAPADPFLRAHKATQHLPVERVSVAGEQLTIKPFILPHVSKLSARDRQSAQIDGAMRENQGFYVYRNDRMIGESSWFRMARKGEMTKFARGAIDIPNSLDSLWKLDIKKSQTVPPESVKQAIRRVIDRFVEGSTKINRFRGRDINQDQRNRVWKVQDTREGFEYRVNREHPIVSALFAADNDDSSTTEEALRLIETSIPAQDIHNRLSSDASITGLQLTDENVLILARNLLRLIPGSLDNRKERLLSLEPFSTSREYSDLVLENWDSVAKDA
jgi:hypothetical protein